MIGETILDFIRSRSFWDLLLVFISYSLGWYVNILTGLKIFGVFSCRQKLIISASFLGISTLIFKPYLPLYPLNLIMLITLIFVLFQVFCMGLWHSIGSALLTNILAYGSDFIILQSLFQIPGTVKFIGKTSLGFLVGTIIESFFQITLLIILKAVKRCRKTIVIP